MQIALGSVEQLISTQNFMPHMILGQIFFDGWMAPALSAQSYVKHQIGGSKFDEVSCTLRSSITESRLALLLLVLLPQPSHCPRHLQKNQSVPIISHCLGFCIKWCGVKFDKLSCTLKDLLPGAFIILGVTVNAN